MLLDKVKNLINSKKTIIILVGIFLLAIIAISFISYNTNSIKADCSRVGDMLTPRSGHLAVVLDNGKVLIVGGYNSTGNEEPQDILQTEIFDPEVKRFDFSGTTHYPHFDGERPIKTIKGKFIFINHLGEIEIFDPKQNKFIKSNTTPFKRYLSACYIGDNKVLLILGHSNSLENKKNYHNSDLYLYDINSDSFLKVGIIEDLLREPYTIKISDSNVLLLGGYKIIKQNNKYIHERNSGVYSISLKNFKTKKVGKLPLFRTNLDSNNYYYVSNVFKINKNEILIAYYNGKLEIYNTQTNSSSILDDINIKNTKREFLFFTFKVFNEFYQIDNYNYLVMQDGKSFYLLNIKEKTIRKICRLGIDAESFLITFLNNDQILITGIRKEGLDDFFASMQISGNRTYFCKITGTE